MAEQDRTAVTTNTRLPKRADFWSHYGQATWSVAELGVKNGRHAAIIAASCSRGRLFLIDHWKDYQNKYLKISLKTAAQFMAQAVMRCPKATFIRSDIDDASFFFASRTLDAVYIDGDHSAKSVLSNLIHWYPKVKVNGWIGGHDLCNEFPGVREALNIFMHQMDIPCLTTVTLDQYPSWFIQRTS